MTTEHGDGAVARAGEILRAVVGSEVHYSLRRYLRLATVGNPTALRPLFAPPDSVVVSTPLGEELRMLGKDVLSRRAVHRFVGYLDAQHERLLGRGRRSNVPNRPGLVERYGYDVKYASHALRLGLQGLEIVRGGRLTLPMPPAERERVLAVKRGDVRELGDVLAGIAEVRAEIVARLDAGDSPLPTEPDLTAVDAWAVDAHRRHWGW